MPHHVDNNLVGTPSIAIGLGDYVGGRLRLEGAKQPLHIRDHAVVFDGTKLHSSGKFNGDRWSLVLFVHSSWETTAKAMRQQLIWARATMSPSGSPTVAVPAVEGVSTSQDGFSSDAAAEAEESAEDVEVARDPKPKGTLEEAQPREHQMTRLPKSPLWRRLL